MDFGPSGAERYGTFDRATGAPDEALLADGIADDPALPGLDFGNIGAVDDGVAGAGGSDDGIGSVPASGIAGIGMGDVASGSSTGTRGFPSARAGYSGRERRRGDNPDYAGPERRLIGV
jgi:hypothetical protein